MCIIFFIEVEGCTYNKNSSDLEKPCKTIILGSSTIKLKWCVTKFFVTTLLQWETMHIFKSHYLYFTQQTVSCGVAPKIIRHRIQGRQRQFVHMIFVKMWYMWAENPMIVSALARLASTWYFEILLQLSLSLLAAN